MGDLMGLGREGGAVDTSTMVIRHLMGLLHLTTGIMGITTMSRATHYTIS